MGGDPGLCVPGGWFGDGRVGGGAPVAPRRGSGACTVSSRRSAPPAPRFGAGLRLAGGRRRSDVVGDGDWAGSTAGGRVRCADRNPDHRNPARTHRPHSRAQRRARSDDCGQCGIGHGGRLRRTHGSAHRRATARGRRPGTCLLGDGGCVGGVGCDRRRRIGAPCSGIGRTCLADPDPPRRCLDGALRTPHTCHRRSRGIAVDRGRSARCAPRGSGHRAAGYRRARSRLSRGNRRGWGPVRRHGSGRARRSTSIWRHRCWAVRSPEDCPSPWLGSSQRRRRCWRFRVRVLAWAM